MEKLVTLLNEYEKDGLNEFETYVERWYCERTGQILSGKWENNNDLKPCEIISKNYGFIKWLVENDKIERLAFAESGLLGKYTDFELSYDTPREDYTNMLLMELSIQDNPIEYLISVLR